MDVSDLTIGIASLSATALGQIATFTEWWFAMPDPSLDLQESNEKEPAIKQLRAEFNVWVDRDEERGFVAYSGFAPGLTAHGATVA